MPQSAKLKHLLTGKSSTSCVAHVAYALGLRTRFPLGRGSFIKSPFPLAFYASPHSRGIIKREARAQARPLCTSRPRYIADRRFCFRLGLQHTCLAPRQLQMRLHVKTVWPSGLRRWLQAPVRKGVGSKPTAVIGSRKAKKAGAAQASENCNCHLCHNVQSSSTCLRGRAALLLLRT